MPQKTLLFAFFFISLLSFGQEESLFNIIRSQTESDDSLLPDRMVFTQSLLWGEKGVMRKTGWYPLNAEQREKELKLRRSMLNLHQIIGYTTLAGLITQGVLGTKLYNGEGRLYDTHRMIGDITSISYFTGASLSLFAPPPLTNKKQKGLNSIKAHKYLATLHFSAMVATNVLAGKNTRLHRAAAFTAFGSYATAIIVFKF
ncbi:MAG: hypothetical protein ABGW63_00405 [Flavobacteriaceae bacterium]